MLIFMPVFIFALLSILIFCFRSFAILLFYCMLALNFYFRSPTVLLFYYVFASFFCFKSLAILLSCYISALIASTALFLFYYTPIFYCKILVFLLPYFVFCLSLFSIFLSFKIFK